MKKWKYKFLRKWKYVTGKHCISLVVAAWNSRITFEELEELDVGEVEVLDGNAAYFTGSSMEFENYL